SKTSFASLISQFPYYLDLELKQLVIFDQTSGQNYQIDRVQLDLQQHDDSFHLKLVTDLPDPLGGQLTIKSIVKPDHSQVYLKSSRLELVRFAELFDINTFALQAAELSGEFWINFLGNQIVELDGSVSVKQGLVQAEQGNEAFDFALSSQISVRQSQGRWTISVQIDDLQMDNKVLRPFNSEIRIATNTGQTRIEGWVDIFEL
ncbi:MAG: hypothetical protein O6927_00945, partial [Gammaproteobacteria bacterium]|nr:hypothetical protein [Gammaproteobacteria bacterium]